MDTLINLENIERVTLRLSSIDKSYVWLEERPQQIVGKWWYILIGRGKKIIPYKPAGFYYNGNYNSPLENYSTHNLIIDTENKKIKRKAELFIKWIELEDLSVLPTKYKNDYQNFYFNSDENFYFNSDEKAKEVFNEIKNKTKQTFLHIDLIELNF